MRHLLFIVSIFITGCHVSGNTVSVENSTTEPSAEIITDDANSVELSDQLPDTNKDESNNTITKSPQEYIQSHLAEITSGAILAYPYQHDITHPNLNTSLYLMRAARYAEAADTAKRIEPQTRASRFIAAKASILAHKCTNQAPVSPEIQSLKKSNKNDYLNIVYDYWLIRAYIDEGEFSKAAASIKQFEKAYASESGKLRELILSYAPAVIHSEQQDENITNHVIALLKKVESGGNTFEASSALHLRYELAMKHHPDEATAHARKLVTNYPATQMAQWPQLFDDVKSSLSANERYQRALKLIKHFDYEDARNELYDLVQNKRLSGKQLTNAEWELARIAMTNTDNPKLSEGIYRRIASENGPNKEEATFGIARSLSRQLDYRNALKALDTYAAAYPKGKYAKRTLYLQGWYWFEIRENDKARPYLKKYAETTNDTAVWGFYAQTFIREQKWAEAIKSFEKLKDNRNPIVRGKALYWQAYALHELGRNEEADAHLDSIHKEFPFTYYDLLAFRLQERWGQINFRDAVTARLNWERDPGAPECDEILPWGRGCLLPGPSNAASWQQIENLIAHDEVAQARRIYQQNENTILNAVIENKRASFKRYATHLTENYHAAWESASGSIRALSSDYPQRSNPRFQMAYPQAFAPLVETLSDKYGVPKYFIYGIMLQESRFRPWQISTADAIGALQMIPKTAAWVAKQLNLEYHPETFFDPKVGFEYSVYYMRIHLNLWHNNLTFTAGSYNGGPHRIGPWMMRDKDKTMDFIVEEFSFDESRHYARKVAEHTLRYLYLYAQSIDEQLRVIEMLFPREIIAEMPEDGWGI